MAHRIEVEVDLIEPIDSKTLERIRACAREAIILELYAQGKITSGHAAQVLGIDRFGFLELAGRRQVPTLQTTPQELDEEMAFLNSIKPRS